MQVPPSISNHRLNTMAITFLFIVASLASPVFGSEACPELLGHWWAGPPRGLAQAGEIVVSAIGKRLVVFDISDGDPVEIGDLVFDTTLGQVVIADGFVCIRFGVSGIKVIDISDPTQPVETATFDLQAEFREMYLFGRSLFLLGSGRLDLVDISDPANPALIDSMITDANTITVNGDYLYLAENNQTFSLAVIDLNNGLTNTRHWVHIPGFGLSLQDLASLGSHLFVIAPGTQYPNPYSLLVLDISDPIDPQLLSHLSITERNTYLNGMVIDGSRLAIGIGEEHPTQTTILSIDVHDPLQPIITQELTIPPYGGFPTLSLDNGKLVVQGGSNGLQVYIDDNDEFIVHGEKALPLDVYSVAANGDVVLANAGSLFLLDPVSTETIGLYTEEPSISVVSLRDDFAYLGINNGLDILNISDPAQPETISSLRWEQFGFAKMIMAGTRAFLVHDRSTIFGGYFTPTISTVDVGDRQNPDLLSVLELPQSGLDWTARLSYSNELLFLARKNALSIVNMSDPFDPVLMHIHNMQTHQILSASARGNYLYACAEGGFLVFDTTDLETLELVGETPQPCSQLTLAGNRAFVTPPFGQLDASFSVIDISSPTNPTALATIQTGGQPTDIVIDSGRAYVIEEHTGIGMYDVHCLLDENHTRWIDVVAHGDGLNNSHWRSDVVVFNTHHEATSVEFVMHTDSGTFGLSTVVDANHGGVFEDIAGLILGEGKGALEIHSAQPVSISGRTYTTTGDESHGQYARAYAPGEGLRPGMIGRLLQLRQEEGRFRSNIVLANIGPEDAIVEIVLLKPDGSELWTYYLEIAAGRMIQDIEPLKARAGMPLIGWASARLQLATGSEILASASLIDASTNDATTIPLIFDEP